MYSYTHRVWEQEAEGNISGYICLYNKSMRALQVPTNATSTVLLSLSTVEQRTMTMMSHHEPPPAWHTPSGGALVALPAHRWQQRLSADAVH